METVRPKQEYLKFEWSKFILRSESWICFNIQLGKSGARTVLWERHGLCLWNENIVQNFIWQLRGKEGTGGIYSGGLQYKQRSLNWNVISSYLFTCFDSLYTVLLLRNKDRTSFICLDSPIFNWSMSKFSSLKYFKVEIFKTQTGILYLSLPLRYRVHVISLLSSLFYRSSYYLVFLSKYLESFFSCCSIFALVFSYNIWSSCWLLRISQWFLTLTTLRNFNCTFYFASCNSVEVLYISVAYSHFFSEWPLILDISYFVARLQNTLNVLCSSNTI